jgi:coenzyme PQQ precursor peptide PqqA
MKSMPNQRTEACPESPKQTLPAWTKPSFELISLGCEITSYAPDGDSPLF